MKNSCNTQYEFLVLFFCNNVHQSEVISQERSSVVKREFEENREKPSLKKMSNECQTNPKLSSRPRELTVPEGRVIKEEGRQSCVRLERRLDRATARGGAVGPCGVTKDDHRLGYSVVPALALGGPETLVRDG